MTSKKFFSLIHGESVHVAPKTRIIPGSQIATLMEAQEVLEETLKDAEKYKKEVVGETEKLKEQAQREGYEAGFKQWAEHVAKLETEIEKVRKETEQKIIPVALKAAKKIVGREIELSESVIVDIVATNLKAVSQHKKITIYVNKKDLEALEANKNRLKQMFETLESLVVREKSDVKPGGCIIETEGGIINAQLENQWRILEEAFAGLMKAKPPTEHK